MCLKPILDIDGHSSNQVIIHDWVMIPDLYVDNRISRQLENQMNFLIVLRVRLIVNTFFTELS